MRVGALFAGVGGLERGLHEAGHRAIMTCEVWAPAQAVLATRFPGVPNFDDVRRLKSLPREVELLTAGFPCQDLSQAGKTAGIGGNRSGLIEQVFRLLDQRKVPLVVLENVSFMLQLDQGAAMDRLACAFEERGYRWAYRTLSTLAFLPQRRERVFFVASKGDVDPEQVLFADDVKPPETRTNLSKQAHGFYWTEGVRGLGWAPDAVPTLKNGSTVGIPSPPAILLPDGRIIKPDIRDAERLQGFPANWTAVAPERLRWSLVGNAVSVPVAAWLGRRISQPGDYAGERDREWSRTSGSFPKAARFDGRKRRVVEIGMYPLWRKRSPLHKFLRYEGTLLSCRATAGFLARAKGSSLRFVPGFIAAVEAHLARMEHRREADEAAARGSRKRGDLPMLMAAE